MKIGDYVTTQEIANQSECRWVVLIDLDFTQNGAPKGGIIKYIADTKNEAGDVWADLNLQGIATLLTCGALEPLAVGGVFVE